MCSKHTYKLILKIDFVALPYRHKNWQTVWQNVVMINWESVVWMIVALQRDPTKLIIHYLKSKRINFAVAIRNVTEGHQSQQIIFQSFPLKLYNWTSLKKLKFQQLCYRHLCYDENTTEINTRLSAIRSSHLDRDSVILVH
jgi:hypothetical protein